VANRHSSPKQIRNKDLRISLRRGLKVHEVLVRTRQQKELSNMKRTVYTFLVLSLTMVAASRLSARQLAIHSLGNHAVSLQAVDDPTETPEAPGDPDGPNGPDGGPDGEGEGGPGQ
jgi:hypothetical protein